MRRTRHATRAQAYALPVLAGVALIALTGAMFLARDQLSNLTGLGYVGALLTTLVGSSSIAVPTPSIPVVFLLGGTEGYQPWLLGLAAGFGSATGELTGFLFGASTRHALGDTRLYRRLVPLMQRWGPALMFAFCVIPNPAVKVAAAAAGASRMRPPVYLAAVFAGKTLKYGIIAYAGFWGFELVADWFSFL